MTINGETILDPSRLVEQASHLEQDNTSLNYSTQRNRLGSKWIVVLTWINILPSEHAPLFALFNPGQAVEYSNPDSIHGTLSFTGLPRILSDGDYEKGGSHITKELVVQIKES